jgi:hypothetical protein
MKMSGQRHAPAALPQERTLVLLDGRLCGCQDPFGLCGQKKNLTVLEIELRFLDCPALSLDSVPTELSGSQLALIYAYHHIAFSWIGMLLSYFFASQSVECWCMSTSLCRYINCRSQRPRTLRRELSSPAQTGIVGSNPTRSMDVCVRLFCLCCPVRADSGLATR